MKRIEYAGGRVTENESWNKGEDEKFEMTRTNVKERRAKSGRERREVDYPFF